MHSAMLKTPHSRPPSDAHTNADHHGDNEPRWERTRRAEERLPAIPLNDGLFKGREIIHRDSRIDGGVSLGATGREAIVVDWRHEATPGAIRSLASLYAAAVERATLDGRFRRSLALQAVYDTVRVHFVDCSSGAVERVNERIAAGPDDKVHLDCYIAARAGVCRHLALACAAILERMIDNGMLRGHVSHDRNSIPGQGAHAWCRYTTSSGEVVILDAMQGFLGTLQESQKPGIWNYARPEERSAAA